MVTLLARSTRAACLAPLALALALAHAPAALAAKAPPPPAAAPDVRLTVAEESPVRWRMRVENAGAVPVRVMADARLLALDVTPAGAKKTVRCVLPADMRPEVASERALVVPPQRAYVESFDPRLYCFGAAEAAALAPGATVVAHLGWVPAAAAKARAPKEPFVVEPLPMVVPAVAPLKELVSAPWSVAALAGAAAPPPAAPAAPAEDAPLEVSSQEHADAARPAEVFVTVTVTNRGAATVTTLLRAETLAFDVIAPDGAVYACGGGRAVDSPIRELYEAVGPRRHASVSVLLAQLCPVRTFELPGLYAVTAILDTRRASGRSAGLATFDGLLSAAKPTRLRVRQVRSPPLAPRPTLE